MGLNVGLNVGSKGSKCGGNLQISLTTVSHMLLVTYEISDLVSVDFTISDFFREI